MRVLTADEAKAFEATHPVWVKVESAMATPDYGAFDLRLIKTRDNRTYS